MAKVKNKLGLGAFVLLASGLICKALGALFRLPLTNLLGLSGIGIFQLVTSLYAFALVLCSGGVTNALSKLIASARARGEIFKVHLYFKRAIFVCLIISLCVGGLFVLLSRFICALQGINATSCYMLFVILLPLGAALATFRGLFQGYENMVPTAISQVLEQVFKFAFGLVFAYFGSRMGTEYGVLGAFVGIVVAELAALIFLFVLFVFKSKNNPKTPDFKDAKLVKKQFDHANFTLTFSASILPLTNAFDALIIVPRLMLVGYSNAAATTLFGLQSGVVGALLNFPLIISVAVATAFLPNVSYLISRGSAAKPVIERGLLVLLFLILPSTFGLVAISRPLISIFYKGISTNLLNIAQSLLLYGGFSIVFTALMQYLVMLLQASGHFAFQLGITTLGGVAKVLFTFFLASSAQINIFALVVGNLALTGIVCVLALFKLKKILPFCLKFFDLFLLLLACSAMYFSVYTFLKCGYFGTIASVAISVVLGGIVYLVLTLPVILKMLKRKRL